MPYGKRKRRLRLIRLATSLAVLSLLFVVYHIYIGGEKRRLPLEWKEPLLDPAGRPEGRLTRTADASTRGRANATLLSLVRNSELSGILQSMRDLERTFNSKFNYPWTFVNDVPFSDNFKRATRRATKADCLYEVIPRQHWDRPGWINEDLMDESAALLREMDVQYASMGSYHKMCRWNSGFFYHHPALQNFRYYWRVEPNVHFFCDIDYDVFHYMSDNDKTYGFVINIYDSPESISLLWPTVEEFIAEHPEYLHPNNAMGWLKEHDTRPAHYKKANGYSTCHFWSNFEIGDMDFWRSAKYEEFFRHLDRAGGFFYERVLVAAVKLD